MLAPKPTRSRGDLQKMPRDCQNKTDDNDNDDNNDEKEALFLREKIVEVAREGDTSEMEYLLGVSIARKLLTAVDKSSTWSLLHFSCSRGFLDITRMLLEAGANPMEAVDKHGKTCLHVAIERDRLDVIRLLLERYPPAKWPRRSKLTLGQTAARAGSRAAMLLLLQNGLDPNERGIRGETPLHQAARHGHAGVIELLLEYEADVSAREGWAGRTPLHYACQSGSLKSATTLIVEGRADPHLPDLSAARHTPLETAVVSGHRSLSHRLVILVDTRRRAEVQRRETAEGSAAAAREATLRGTEMARRRVSALRGKVAAKRSLVRMEKRELADALQGQIARANTRLRSLHSQCERLQLKEAAGGPARLGPCSAANNGQMRRRPSTCPALPAAGGLAATRPRRQRPEYQKAVQSAGGVDEKNGPAFNGRRQGRGLDKPSARVVWGAGG